MAWQVVVLVIGAATTVVLGVLAGLLYRTDTRAARLRWGVSIFGSKAWLSIERVQTSSPRDGEASRDEPPLP